MQLLSSLASCFGHHADIPTINRPDEPGSNNLTPLNWSGQLPIHADARLRTQAQSLTCVTVFPNDLEELISSEQAYEPIHQSNSVSHLYQMAELAGQINYGDRCHEHCVNLSHQLSDGTIQTYSQLWDAARESICQIRVPPGSIFPIHPMFKTLRQPLVGEEQPLTYTPWGSRYIHVARQMVHDLLDKTPSSLLFEPLPTTVFKTADYELSIKPSRGDFCLLEHTVWGQPDPELNLPSIPLTRLSVCFEKKLLGLPRNDPHIGQMLETSIRPHAIDPILAELPWLMRDVQKINHTSAIYLSTCKAQLEHLFNKLIYQQHTLEKTVDLMARMYWWSAHAMFDERGSAAKTELLFRALCKAKSLQLPPWKAGVSADLVCMTMDETRWLREFSQYLAVWE